MRFLADAGILPKTVDFLNQLGHAAVHVRTLGMERAADSDLVARAREDSSVVVTFDLDFGDILALGVLDKPSVIICRLVGEARRSTPASRFRTSTTGLPAARPISAPTKWASRRSCTARADGPEPGRSTGRDLLD